MAIYNSSPHFDFWTDLKQGADRFELTRDTTGIRDVRGRYRFGLETSNGKAPNPLGACPSTVSTPPEVQARQTNDLKAMNALIDNGIPTATPYSDGGMHPSFRKVLKQRGADYLSNWTSSTDVPVSRPKAALADPYPIGHRARQPGRGTIIASKIG